MQKWKIGTGLLVLFLSGVLIGSVGTRVYIRHKISGIFARERPPIRDLFFRRLTRELDLTAEQRKEIDGVASSAAERFQALHRQQREEAEAFLDQTVSEMKKYLIPEQQERLDEIRNRMRAWRNRPRHPHHGPPPPHPLPSQEMMEPHPPPPPPPPTSPGG